MSVESTTSESASAGSAPSLGPEELALGLERLRAQQSLARGLLWGAAAALAGAGAWAGITTVFEYQIGWMAVGVGVLVGQAVRHGGRGQAMAFGLAGGALSLLGCVLGNLLAGVGFVAASQDVAFLDVLVGLSASGAVELLELMSSPIDVLFYGLALHQGYKLAFHPITSADVARALGR